MIPHIEIIICVSAIILIGWAIYVRWFIEDMKRNDKNKK